MDIKLVPGSPSTIETECLVTIALDHGEKQQNAPKLTCLEQDAALEKAVAELIANGEITCKASEPVLLDDASGLKAKRLLAVGGGKAPNFTSFELRRAAGTAVRFLRSRMIKSCAFVLPGSPDKSDDAARAIVEGAFVADFDPDTYRTDRKD